MLEYASIRFVFVWARATMFPPVIVTAASTARTALQSTLSGPRAPTRTRRIAAKAAAFGPTDMNAVAGVAAPSYASGVHWWKGTIAALKPRPTVIRASATMVGPFAIPCAARKFAIVAKLVAL